MQERSGQAREQEFDAACRCGRHSHPAATSCHFSLHRAAGDYVFKAAAQDTGWKQVKGGQLVDGRVSTGTGGVKGVNNLISADPAACI